MEPTGVDVKVAVTEALIVQLLAVLMVVVIVARKTVAV